MKSIVMHQMVQLNQEIKDQLTKEVKETLATDVNVDNSKKVYTIAELWNSRKNFRSASYRMSRWNMN